MRTFDFFYDLASPYSYLASTQLEGIESRTGAKARLLPVPLGGIRKSTGRQIPPAAQQEYIAQDTARWATKYGVRMLIPRPVSTARALRACIVADQTKQGQPAMRALFEAHWVHDQDLSDPRVIASTLDRAGLDGNAVLARTEDEATLDALRRNTELALARGVFGVPTIFVGERSFWGNDRLEFVERELKQS
jgi:2-hydroxychromene-2-carboxylate isomerase